MDINHCCCFTGHRPEKLHIPESVVLQELNIAITAALQDGHTTFISGMAKGVDIWAAELILERRRASPEINLICAIPYEGFGLHWKDEWTERFTRIIHAANSVEYVSKEFSRPSFQRRNKWVVDRSSLLIAAYTGASGGTKNTIKYAEHKGIKIQYLRFPK